MTPTNIATTAQATVRMRKSHIPASSLPPGRMGHTGMLLVVALGTLAYVGPFELLTFAIVVLILLGSDVLRRS